ncbi:MAG TPA: hypothetical protein VJV78_45430 [Polyangiales bacterium]|nr:hypothetical protein [Polyangiales bacterium]
MRALVTLGVLLALSIACTQRASEPAIAQPAPAPPTPSPPAPPVAEPAAEPPIDHPRVPPAPAKASKPHAAPAKPAQAKPDSASKPSPAPAAAPEPEPSPVAAEPTPAPAPKPATRVNIPNTEHVRVEVPAGLQAWLDKDTRMQPWLAKVMKVIDDCYAGVRADNPSAAGTISFRVTMHENARPDPDIQSLPGPLSGVVACATGQLMRARMPLFTGREGDSYVVHVKFQ